MPRFVAEFTSDGGYFQWWIYDCHLQYFIAKFRKKALAERVAYDLNREYYTSTMFD